jgi:AcrR family transcriptional regulator
MGIAERKEREKELRRKQIQDAAIEVFISKGFNSATMEDIANQAELSLSTVYLYFGSKHELYTSLNLSTLQYLHDGFEKVHTDDLLSVEEKIIGYKDVMYSTFQYNPTILKIIYHVQLYEILPSLDKKLLDQLNDLGQKMMNMVAATHKEGVQQGVFEEGHGMQHADILWAIFSGLIVWVDAKRQIDPRKDFLKCTLDRACEIFCQGIKKNSHIKK